MIETLEARNLSSASLGSSTAADFSVIRTGTTLTIRGTVESDAITVWRGGRVMHVVVNGNEYAIDARTVNQLEVLSGGGNDYVDLSRGDRPSRVAGSTGDDTIAGGNYADVLLGDDGDDLLLGYAGNDTLEGGGGVSNVLQGGLGNDRLDGGFGFGRMDGGAGADTAVRVKHRYKIRAIDVNELNDTPPSAVGQTTVSFAQNRLGTWLATVDMTFGATNFAVSYGPVERVGQNFKVCAIAERIGEAGGAAITTKSQTFALGKVADSAFTFRVLGLNGEVFASVKNGA